ncbi:hypothetical protein [Pseudomonas gingeri]|uniref:hypothetical protein n=1 Tax=Pseudomonas gingeri TaxID=117681 RepID=UPI0015A0D3A6|nr:hypothetical protein [Pseudomonas gingeri]NWA05046.1 hypothetical protein [Pseudomonas gingeri]NWA18211.1 hypothetical protein [Pseudomonas gingeri]NWA58609.1 hypothetical protein [Pseudomonas gingeri]NWA99592.1 hypothetical protein [Pseudomonas gingeri]NWA99719.1 hypothetical protein [Pseudomonas gingeri]
MINQKLQPKPKVDLPEQAKVGDVLTLTGSIVNAFSGLYLLHFWKGGNDAPFISGFDVVDWETISFVVPNKVGQVTVTGIYALSSSLPEEVQFLASLTIESA